jgi:hypothetical protein
MIAILEAILKDFVVWVFDWRDECVFDDIVALLVFFPFVFGDGQL